MPPKLQLLAVVAFAVAMLFLENQIQKLEESRSKLGEEQSHSGLSAWCGKGGRAGEALQTRASGRSPNLGSGLAARGWKRLQRELGTSRAQAPRIV